MIRRILPVLALALLCGLGACDANGHTPNAQKAKAMPAQPVPLGRLSRVVVPTRYRLTMTIDPRGARFRGHDEISVTIARPVGQIDLHGRNLQVNSVLLRLADGETIKARYRQVDPTGVARLTLERPAPAGRATLVFDYEAPFNRSLAGLYKVERAGLDYAFTQFEASDARRMFPCFDEPGFKTPFDVVVNAPRGDTVIANTPVISKNATGGGTIHWVFAATKKLPTYLLALAVGPFDVVNAGTIPADALRKRPIALRGIAARGEGRQMRYALSLTPKIVLALEHYFGVPYPFAKLDMIAVPDFAAGAMENAGAITFRERFLLMGPHAPLAQRRASLLVQAHELTHQWFGDLVTPAWWDDIWLNEAFANWMEAKAAAAVMPDGQFGRRTLDGGLAAMGVDELPSARRIHNPVEGAGDIADAFDAITYDKGAAVLAMFEHYVGEPAWQAAIHAYLGKFAGGNAAAHDFIGTVAAVTHRPEIVAAFNSYIDQAGIPDLSVVLRCGDRASLSVVQSMYAPIGRMVPDRQWQVPACIAGPGLKSYCRIVGRTAELPLGGACPAAVMPNAQGTGYYRFAYDAKGWQALIKASADLGPADQRTLFANVDAALHADQADAGDLFAAIRAMAPSAQWDLLQAMDASLRGLRVHLLTDKDMAAYRRFVRDNFAPRLTALGLKPKPHEAPAATLARVALVRLLVEEGRDPATLAALSRAAAIYLASGERSLGGLAPDLADEALRAGVLSEGADFASALMAAYQNSKDDYFHRSAIHALAAAQDPALLDGVFALALTGKMHIGDIFYLFAYMGSQPVARTALWSWFQLHYAALDKRLSDEGMSAALAILAPSCDPASRAALDGFFHPKLNTIPGLGRELDLAEQHIDRCIAFKDAKAKAVRQALAKAVSE